VLFCRGRGGRRPCGLPGMQSTRRESLPWIESCRPPVLCPCLFNLILAAGKEGCRGRARTTGSIPALKHTNQYQNQQFPVSHCILSVATMLSCCYWEKTGEETKSREKLDRPEASGITIISICIFFLLCKPVSIINR
jgi:hypothetical protein